MIPIPSNAPDYAHDIGRRIDELASPKRPVRLPLFVSSNLPDPAKWERHFIWVDSGSGTASPAYSDGSDWLYLIGGTSATQVLLTGTGAPTATVADGAYYFRGDGTAGSQIYHRTGGAWVAIL